MSINHERVPIKTKKKEQPRLPHSADAYRRNAERQGWYNFADDRLWNVSMTSLLLCLFPSWALMPTLIPENCGQTTAVRPRIPILAFKNKNSCVAELFGIPKGRLERSKSSVWRHAWRELKHASRNFKVGELAWAGTPMHDSSYLSGTKILAAL